jgi:hypothetical protein
MSPKKLWLALAVVAVLAVLAFRWASLPRDAAVYTFSDQATYVFHDRSQRRLAYVYVLRDRQIVAQAGDYLGFGEWQNRRWFHCPRVPDDVLAQARTWVAWRGDSPGPYGPDAGPPFCRYIVRPGAREQYERADFTAASPAARDWSAALREAVVRDEYRVERPPEWVQRDRELKAHFGITE